MFENIFSNIKTHSAKMSNSLSIDNLKEHTARLAESIDVLKTKVQVGSSRVGAYLLSQRDVDVEPARPSESYVHLEDVKDPQMSRWLTPGSVDEDEDSIVDRFIRVITIEDEDNSCQVQNTPPPAHRRRRVSLFTSSIRSKILYQLQYYSKFSLTCCSGAMTERKYGADLPWVLRMLIITVMISDLGKSQVFRLDFRVVSQAPYIVCDASFLTSLLL